MALCSPGASYRPSGIFAGPFDYHCQLYLRGSLQSEHEWDCDRPRAAKRGLYKRMGWAMGGGVGANAGVRKWSAGALVAVMGHARAMDDQPCQ